MEVKNILIYGIASKIVHDFFLIKTQRTTKIAYENTAEFNAA